REIMREQLMNWDKKTVTTRLPLLVREYESEAPRFSMVFVEFEHDTEKFPVGIYTYGTHKGLAFCSQEEPTGEAGHTARMQFGYLLSFKRLIDKARLDALYDEMLEKFEKKPMPRSTLFGMACKLAVGRDLLVVAAESSLDWYRKAAKKKGLSIATLSKEAMGDRPFKQIQSFNIYYHLYE
ncbi:MAG TPA: hypothetical protein PKO06_16940, partial [Candidatus Ozemobacteraceae bacterium]|nr:hypothetical protein [Candidatus Ozemobacteraceae bacterium]